MSEPQLILPAFVAGLLTFLAPCILPLLPGFLGFISGASVRDLTDPKRAPAMKVRVVLNGLLFVVGFSIVFILLGTLFGLGGGGLARYREVISRVGGIIVMLFGLFMVGAAKLPFLPFLGRDTRFHLPHWVAPGTLLASLLFGSTFAFGWSPCIGPVLATVLFLASRSGTAVEGAFLLGVFSLGLAVPFMIMALAVGSALSLLRRMTKALNIISVIGGVFLIVIGLLLITDAFDVWVGYAYRLFHSFGYEGILRFL